MPRGTLTFGEYVRQLRAEQRIPLRKAAANASIDPGNLSRYERGLSPAPQDDDVLARLAGVLGLEKGTEEYQRFMDLASVSAGKIPPDLLENQSLLGRLPVLFRAARGRNLSRRDLIALAKKIQDS